MWSNLIYSLYIPMRYFIIMHTSIEFLIIRIFFLFLAESQMFISGRYLHQYIVSETNCILLIYR